jgi:hypothetical protein
MIDDVDMTSFRGDELEVRRPAGMSAGPARVAIL